MDNFGVHQYNTFYISYKEMIILEIWKTITFATNYEVSNLGNVRNKKSGQILNPGISGQGYK